MFEPTTAGPMQTMRMDVDPKAIVRDGGLEYAVARGGPMDGAILGLADAESYEVRAADRTRWKYLATADRELLTDGSWAVVFVSAGRW